MPKVTFLPSNKTFNANVGDSLLDIALNEGVSIQHACGGFCACTTCHCLVESGATSLTSIEDDEQERLDHLPSKTPQSRLACQAKVTGDVTVKIVNSDY